LLLTTKVLDSGQKLIYIYRMKNLYLQDEDHADLQGLAEADHRTLGGEVAWLIEAELARRPRQPADRPRPGVVANGTLVGATSADGALKLCTRAPE